MFFCRFIMLRLNFCHFELGPAFIFLVSILGVLFSNVHVYQIVFFELETTVLTRSVFHSPTIRLCLALRSAAHASMSPYRPYLSFTAAPFPNKQARAMQLFGTTSSTLSSLPSAHFHAAPAQNRQQRPQWQATGGHCFPWKRPPADLGWVQPPQLNPGRLPTLPSVRRRGILFRTRSESSLPAPRR